MEIILRFITFGSWREKITAIRQLTQPTHTRLIPDRFIIHSISNINFIHKFWIRTFFCCVFVEQTRSLQNFSFRKSKRFAWRRSLLLLGFGLANTWYYEFMTCLKVESCLQFKDNAPCFTKYAISPVTQRFKVLQAPCSAYDLTFIFIKD